MSKGGGRRAGGVLSKGVVFPAPILHLGGTLQRIGAGLHDWICWGRMAGRVVIDDCRFTIYYLGLRWGGTRQRIGTGFRFAAISKGSRREVFGSFLATEGTESLEQHSRNQRDFHHEDTKKHEEKRNFGRKKAQKSQKEQKFLMLGLRLNFLHFK